MYLTGTTGRPTLSIGKGKARTIILFIWSNEGACHNRMKGEGACSIRLSAECNQVKRMQGKPSPRYL
uniref:Uncharacterized protein n=1 Tax=Picea glauca TaxID=3330 RepID=A0A101M485_PICGL|nr:hypothetical protein ABT39_MTgene498 [Picea glauca]QHR87950.1 hypothetical protein Q903MT_gene1962 [Picea sitchensis]